MMLLLDTLSALFQWSYVFLFFWILRSFLPLRKPLPLQILAFWVSSVLSCMIIYPQDTVNLLGTLVGFIAYVIIFGCGRWVEKLSAVLIFYPPLVAINFLMQDISCRLFFSITGFGNPDTGWTAHQELISQAFYAIALLGRMLFWLGAWLLLRKYLKQMRAQLTSKMWLMVDALMLTAFVAIISIILATPEPPLLDYPVCIVTVFSCFGCVYLTAYICNTMQAEHHARELELQQANLKDRLQEEARVRSIYHDMKNHLLILQGQTGATEDVHQSVKELQREMETYENYYHTGTPFLDLIIRDKSRVAREHQVDFNVNIQFSAWDFLQPLDISTIFGNALDNALEACDKLPVDERLITLKVSRVRNMLVIMVENSARAADVRIGKTEKDHFLHGFGLSNMKKAAEKYDGNCITTMENGLFTLKIVIPIPE